MVETELEVDVSKLCSKALADLQPGEDIDEALLRTSKKMYGKGGMQVFSMVNHMVNPPGAGNKLENVKKIAKGEGNHRITIKKNRTITKKGGGLFGSTVTGSVVTTSSSISLGSSKDVDLKKLHREMPELFIDHPEMEAEFIDELPKELLDEHPEIRTKLISGDASTSKKNACEKCGYRNPEDTGICINCHAEIKKKKKSFWDRLLGR